MKKLITVTLATVLVAALTLTACGVYMIASRENVIRHGEYDAGFDDGIEWAIENMELYAAESFDADDDEQIICIDLGGMTYEHAIGRK